jgi:hypothetical protein
MHRCDFFMDESRTVTDEIAHSHGEDYAMDVSLASNEFAERAHDTDDSASARQNDLIAPREIVREVATSLKSLSKILPYAEYADIVHRIAQLRWRCESSVTAIVSQEAPDLRPKQSD